jgi:hypothetical protein
MSFATLNSQIQGPGGHGDSVYPLGGFMTPGEVDDLNKALTIGSDRDPPGTFTAGDGFAFRVEDLDPLMRVSTFDSTNIVLWKMLVKQAAENTVVEWNETESYGDDGYEGFMGEGSLPEIQDSVVSRQYAFVKYLGVQGAVSHQSTLIKAAHGNLVARETNNKTNKLLELVERSLFYGNSALDPVQWDGFFTQMQNAITSGRVPASCLLDKRGAPLTVDDVEDVAADASSEPRWGRLTDLFCNPLVKSGLNKSQFPAGRTVVGVGSASGDIGGAFERINTSIGKINVHPDAFINFGRRPGVNGLGDPGRRPSTPILAVAPTTPVDAAARFNLASDAGDYTYSVVARNRFGASVPLNLGAVTVAAGDHVEFGIQASPGQQTLYFEIFRSSRNGTVVQLIQRIPNPNGAFTTVTITDRNEDLPGTTMALIVDWQPEVIDFKQLAPFMKIGLAQVDLNIRWVQCVYGTPRLGLPKKVQLVKNIGRAA